MKDLPYPVKSVSEPPNSTMAAAVAAGAPLNPRTRGNPAASAPSMAASAAPRIRDAVFHPTPNAPWSQCMRLSCSAMSSGSATGVQSATATSSASSAPRRSWKSPVKWTRSGRIHASSVAPAAQQIALASGRRPIALPSRAIPDESGRATGGRRASAESAHGSHAGSGARKRWASSPHSHMEGENARAARASRVPPG